MLRRIVPALLLLVLNGGPGAAQNAAPNAMALVRAADMEIGASKVHSIHYSGQNGYVTVYGQSGTSDVQHQWPRYNLDSFSRVIDYDTMSMREEQIHSQGAWPEGGGGERPITGKQIGRASCRERV